MLDKRLWHGFILGKIVAEGVLFTVPRRLAKTEFDRVFDTHEFAHFQFAHTRAGTFFAA